MPDDKKQFPVKPNKPAVRMLDEARLIVERMKNRGLSHESGTNKLKESIGEYGARLYTERKYAGKIKHEIEIPRRGKGGAPVLDMAYELTDGRVVVLEVKYGQAHLGTTHRKTFDADEAGSVNVFEKKDATKQFSPEWFQDRLDEIRKTQPKLANRLERAWMEGKIEAIIIHVDEHGVLKKTIDRSEVWREFKKTGRKAKPRKAEQAKKKPKKKKAKAPKKKAKAPRPKPPKKAKTTKKKPIAAQPKKVNRARVHTKVKSGLGKIRLSRATAIAKAGAANVVSAVVEIIVVYILEWAFTQIFGDSDAEIYEKFEKEVQAAIEKEFNSEYVQKMFEEASMSKQFWAEVHYIMTKSIVTSGSGGSKTESLVSIQVDHVTIVEWPKKDSSKVVRRETFSESHLTSYKDVHEERAYTTYYPLFDDLSPGAIAAADGQPMSIVEYSHYSKVERRQFIYDYFSFVRQYGELADQMEEAWLYYRSEMCMLGFKQFFLPSDWESCKGERAYYLEQEKKREIEEARMTNASCKGCHPAGDDWKNLLYYGK